MQRELATHPCRSECSWGPTDQTLNGLPLFRCKGCHSEWTPDQPWTPANADGRVPTTVAAARAAHV